MCHAAVQTGTSEKSEVAEIPVRRELFGREEPYWGLDVGDWLRNLENLERCREPWSDFSWEGGYSEFVF